MSLVIRWQILEDFSARDHKNIPFEMVDTTFRCAIWRSPSSWNVAKENIGGFTETFGTDRIALEVTKRGLGVAAGTDADSVINLITTACAAAIPKRASSREKLSTYWMAEIAELQKQCHKRCYLV